MREDELLKLIAEHEGLHLEFKESFSTECIETACAFANANGGYLLIGLDNLGKLSQNQPRFEALRDIENRIATATEPVISVQLEKVPLDSGEVIVVKVPENPLKPIAFRGRCFLRCGSVNHQMTPLEIAECHAKSTGSSMDAVFVPDGVREDLDMEKVKAYMLKANETGRRSFPPNADPWIVLKKLSLVKSDNEITLAAYLLFAKEPEWKCPQAMIHAGAFKLGGAVILDSFDVRGNIQDQIDATMTFIKRNIRCALNVTEAAEHEQVWQYPLEALRETIANAVCHRNYGIPNDIQIKILEDKLVVISPGSLPFDMTVEKLLSNDHGSSPRNRLVAQIFYDLKIIEHYGSGTERIRRDCLRHHCQFPAMTNDAHSFTTVYPSVFSEVDEVEEKDELTTKAKDKEAKDKEAKDKILELLRRNPKMTAVELGLILNLSRSGIEWNLRKLKKEGFLIRAKGKKLGHWEVLK